MDGLKTLRLWFLHCAVLLLSILLLQSSSVAQKRMEVPIYLKMIKDNFGQPVHRFWIYIQINNEDPVPAMLDTGSTALFVLWYGTKEPQKLPLTAVFKEAFGAGDILMGQHSKATLSIGGMRSRRPVDFGLVTKAECLPTVPKCAASKSDFAGYKIASEGRPDEGFHALIGMSFGSVGKPPLRTVLSAFADKWIVELPLPTGNKPGRIVLNPTPDEEVEFQKFKLGPGALMWTGPLRHGIDGCVVAGKTAMRRCGLFAADSGAPGVTIETAETNVFTSLKLARNFVFEFGTAAKVLRWETPIPAFAIHRSNFAAGTTPFSMVLGYQMFWNFSVLFDLKREMIGMKQR